jgi:trans-aconitate 2-methyltransferase
MSASAWSPDQYERFKAERSRPFYDLLALVRPKAGMRVVDLGCGTGELTREMHVALAARETVGVDSSETMLAKSAAFAAPGLSFEKGLLESWAPKGPLDLVFSNAALHWVPDHEALYARFARMLAPGGQVAIQVPSNEQHLSHVVAAEIAREAPFAEALGGWQRVVPNLPLAAYVELLERLGFREQIVRAQVYAQHLESREGVVEWVKGTTLTAYAERMDAPTYARFLERYRERLLPRLADTSPFLFPFQRTFVWGIK